MECLCQDEQCPLTQMEQEDIERRHFADVGVSISLRRCVDCGSQWLHCSIEDCGNAGWNRWYRSPVTGDLGEWSFLGATDALISSSWHFYGGPFYRSSGERAFGSVPIAEVLAPPPAVVKEDPGNPIGDDSIVWGGMGVLA